MSKSSRGQRQPWSQESHWLLSVMNILWPVSAQHFCSREMLKHTVLCFSQLGRCFGGKEPWRKGCQDQRARVPETLTWPSTSNSGFVSSFHQASGWGVLFVLPKQDSWVDKEKLFSTAGNLSKCLMPRTWASRPRADPLEAKDYCSRYQDWRLIILGTSSSGIWQSSILGSISMHTAQPGDSSKQQEEGALSSIRTLLQAPGALTLQWFTSQTWVEKPQPWQQLSDLRCLWPWTLRMYFLSVTLPNG